MCRKTFTQFVCGHRMLTESARCPQAEMTDEGPQCRANSNVQRIVTANQRCRSCNPPVGPDLLIYIGNNPYKRFCAAVKSLNWRLEHLDKRFLRAGVRYHRLHPELRHDENLGAEPSRASRSIFHDADEPARRRWFSEWNEALRIARELSEEAAINPATPDAQRRLQAAVANTEISEARVGLVEHHTAFLEMKQRGYMFKEPLAFYMSDVHALAWKWIRRQPAFRRALERGFTPEQIYETLKLPTWPWPHIPAFWTQSNGST